MILFLILFSFFPSLYRCWSTMVRARIGFTRARRNQPWLLIWIGFIKPQWRPAHFIKGWLEMQRKNMWALFWGVRMRFDWNFQSHFSAWAQSCENCCWKKAVRYFLWHRAAWSGSQVLENAIIFDPIFSIEIWCSSILPTKVLKKWSLSSICSYGRYQFCFFSRFEGSYCFFKNMC